MSPRPCFGDDHGYHPPIVLKRVSGKTSKCQDDRRALDVVLPENQEFAAATLAAHLSDNSLREAHVPKHHCFSNYCAKFAVGTAKGEQKTHDHDVTIRITGSYIARSEWGRTECAVHAVSEGYFRSFRRQGQNYLQLIAIIVVATQNANTLFLQQSRYLDCREAGQMRTATFYVVATPLMQKGLEYPRRLACPPMPRSPC